MVSIIVPNYNHEPYLRQRLDTVFNQTFIDFEVILLDDCSTDNSVAILAEYSNKPQVSHFIVNKINSGSPFKQWRKGIELSKYDYIWIAESDDYNETTFLENLIPYFNINIGIVFSSLTIVEKNKSTLYEALKIGEHNGKELLRSKMITGNLFVNANCVVFNKNFLDNKHLRKIENFTICGDWFLWNQILIKSNVYFVKESLSYYRKHQKATTEDLYNNQTFYKEAIINSKLLINKLGDYYHYNQRAISFYNRLIKVSEMNQLKKDSLVTLVENTFKTNRIKNILRRFWRKLNPIKELK